MRPTLNAWPSQGLVQLLKNIDGNTNLHRISRATDINYQHILTLRKILLDKGMIRMWNESNQIIMELTPKGEAVRDHAIRLESEWNKT